MTECITRRIIMHTVTCILFFMVIAFVCYIARDEAYEQGYKDACKDFYFGYIKMDLYTTPKGQMYFRWSDLSKRLYTIEYLNDIPAKKSEFKFDPRYIPNGPKPEKNKFDSWLWKFPGQKENKDVNNATNN